MNPIANTTHNNIARLDDLAAEARFCVQGINMNLFRLGRVLIEAKQLVDHGEWLGWIRDNAGDMSVTKAENLMAICSRFEGRKEFEGIGQTKLIKLLSLPEGTEDQFIQDHDLDSMTTREVGEAVKRARAEALAEAQGQIDHERELRTEAEARAYELANRPPELPDDVKEELRFNRERLKEAQDNAQHFAELARNAGNAKAELERQNRELRSELDDINADMQEQQRAYDEQQKELFTLRNAQKQGGTEHAHADDMSYEAFSEAVRDFLGLCAPLPYMASTFSTMPQNDKNRYDTMLKSVEGWLEGARRALKSCEIEGGIIVG